MNFKLLTLALVAATATLLGGPSSPEKQATSAATREADIIVIGGGAADCILITLDLAGCSSPCSLDLKQTVQHF